MSAIMEGSASGVDRVTEKTSSTTGAVQSNRIHYLDNLRAMAMLLGVFLHSALAYAQPAQTVWLATDPSASVLVDASVWFIHLFRMGLFFFLSGYFAKLVIERKGLKHFLRSRLLRLVGPFVLFYPFLMGAITIVIVFAISYLAEPRGLMGLIAAAVKGSSDAPKREPLTTMHLWFLYYLVAFTAIGALLTRVQWLKLESLFRNARWLVLSPLLLVPGAFVAGAPMPAPESFIPQWWPFAFYGLYYAAGWQLFGRERFLDAWRPYLWLMFALSVAAYGMYYFLLPVLDLSQIVEGAPAQNVWIRVMESVLTAYLSVLLTLVSLLLGQRYLTSRSPLLSFVADSSYWVYLLHLPIVLFLQTLLVPLALPWWLKLSVVLLGTLLPCFATYVVFVRYTLVGWLLHGKRTFP